MKKFKAIIMATFISIFMIFGTQTTYADSFISPKLNISDKGIRFDKTQNGFKVEGEKNQEYIVRGINSILSEYQILVTFGSGIVSFMMIALFIINFMKLANTKGNPQERSKTVTALIFTGIGTALAGSVTLISQLFYNFL